MRRIWGKRGAEEMKGRKAFRRAAIVLMLAVLLGAGVLASGAFGMVLLGGDATDSTSTATDTTSTSADTTTASAPESTTTASTTQSATTTAPANTAAPTIRSDQEDYAPGSMVTLTGAGWAASERVHIFVNDDVGQTWQYNGDVTTNLDGGFTAQFQLPNSFVATYTVTATGSGGETATTRFTDASTDVRAAPSGVSFTLTYQGFTDSGCATPANGQNGNVQTATVTATAGPNLSGPNFWKLTAGAATAPTGATFSSWASSGGGTFTTLGTNVICATTATSSNNYIYNATYTTVQNQTITVGTHAPANAAFNSSFTVAATASSGLSVAYSSTGVCTNVGATFTVNSGAGTCTVHYNQAGNASFNPAPEVMESVTAQKAAQLISFAALAGKTFGDAPFTVSGTGGGSGNPVTFSVGASDNCTSGGTNGATITITGAGSCTVTANQAGNANYNAAAPVSRSFSIGKADQAISFAALAGKTFGDAPFTVSATGGGSGNPVTFSVGASDNCTSGGTNGATITITGAGSCTVTANQAGNANYNAAAPVSRSFSIGKADQTISFAPLADKTFGDSDFMVSATASSGLTVGFSALGDCTTSLGGFVHITGAGSCTITASQAGNDNYNAAASVPQAFTISKADQTISFGALVDKTYGDADFGVSATASSGLAVNFSASGNCTVSASTVHITGAGSCSVTASQGGDANYNAAQDVTQPFTISKADQTISFGALVDKTYGDADFQCECNREFWDWR